MARVWQTTFSWLIRWADALQEVRSVAWYAGSEMRGARAVETAFLDYALGLNLLCNGYATRRAWGIFQHRCWFLSSGGVRADAIAAEAVGGDLPVRSGEWELVYAPLPGPLLARRSYHGVRVIYASF